MKWLEADFPHFLIGRILAVNLAVAEHWSHLVAQAGRVTALQHGLRLVTHNQRDFELLGLEVINPWNAD